jgi:hypothetical protein
MDWTFTIGNLITIVTIAAGALGAFFFQRARIDAMQVTIAAMELRITETFSVARKARDDLMAFRLHVTESYVQHPSMEKVETRLLGAIQMLTDEIRSLRSEMRNTSARRATRANDGS